MIYVRRIYLKNESVKSRLIDILKHLLTAETKHEFVMEVTDKTRADVKVMIERESVVV